MKATLFVLVFISSLCSCSQSERASNNHARTEKAIEDAWELVEQLPDTVIRSNESQTRKFRLDLDNENIDLKTTARVSGEWRVTVGELKFLETYLDLGDKVVFKNEVNEVATGWGVLTYNRAAKFYSAKSSSHIYDYYVDKDEKLVLVQLEYRNSDLSFKKEPEAIFERLELNFIQDGKIVLVLKDQKIELQKQ